jgi:hypothetical protein
MSKLDGEGGRTGEIEVVVEDGCAQPPSELQGSRRQASGGGDWKL